MSKGLAVDRQLCKLEVSKDVVVETQPGDDAVNVARSSGGQPSFASACAHADSVAFDPSAFRGCYVVKCGTCPVAWTWNVHVGSWWLIPCPLLLGFIPFCPVACACCRQGNHYLLLSRTYKGHLTVVDQERGTLAVYNIACCSDERSEQPCCLCYRIC